MEGYIPRYLLLTSEIRSQPTPEDKAAHIKFLDPNLKMTQICSELKADYQQSLRRFHALKENRRWTGVGRPPLYDFQIIDDINEEISMSYKKGDCTNYTRLREIVDNDYRNRIDEMEPEAREKFPKNLRKNYIYELSRQINLNPKKPVLEEKDRNKCSTSETVHDFFEYTYTEEMIQDVPPQLVLNSDETSVEVSLPKKVLVPEKKQEGKSIDKFSISSHISAMVTINASGDDFPPYVLVPLKNVPKDLLTFVASGKITIGGSPNGWMNDDCFEEWAKWLIQKVANIRETYNFDKNRKAILFLDGHGSRNNFKVMKLFKSNHISVIIFPPHMTHIFQPFDRVIARPLKECLSRIAKEIIDYIIEENQNKAFIIRSTQIQALIDAHRVATTQHNCMKAFESCGLFPRDITKILNNKNVKESKQSFIQNDLNTSRPVKISGLCITSEEILPMLRDKKSKAKK